MDLKQLIIDTKTAWVDFGGLDGFEVEVATLSRKELAKLRKRCIVTKFDRHARIPVEELNEEKFVHEYAKAIVKNWKGLTIDYLQSLVAIDAKHVDPETKMEYSQENAELLIANSNEFDAWLNEVVNDLDNFRDEPEGEDVEEA